MPTINWNHNLWNEEYKWEADGDEWSSPWGSAISQWYTSLLPRLQAFLPAARILEIAPGHGRWTSFLLPYSKIYVGIDLSELCVDFLGKRFHGMTDAHFFANDGISLSAGGGIRHSSLYLALILLSMLAMMYWKLISGSFLKAICCLIPESHSCIMQTLNLFVTWEWKNFFRMAGIRM